MPKSLFRALDFHLRNLEQGKPEMTMKILSIFFVLITIVSFALPGCSPKGLLSMKPTETVNYGLHRYGTEVSSWWPRPVARSAREERAIAEYGPEKEENSCKSEV
jgi:hypothetical protein